MQGMEWVCWRQIETRFVCLSAHVVYVNTCLPEEVQDVRAVQCVSVPVVCLRKKLCYSMFLPTCIDALF